MNKDLIATRIKSKRKENKLTQQELADKIGVSLMSVVRWENGERTPNALIMPQLADILNTSVNYLMGIEDNSDKQVSLITPLGMVGTEQPRLSSPSMSYWGGVLDNAKLAVQNGQNLGLIYSLLSDAAGTVKAAMA